MRKRYEELQVRVDKLQKNDRAHFFWTVFLNNNIINGGASVVSVSKREKKKVTVVFEVDYHGHQPAVFRYNDFLTIYREV